MSVKAGASWSNVKDAFEAGHEAATLALHQIDNESADLALIFSSADYAKPELLEGVRSAVGPTPILGCTDAGSLVVDGPKGNAVAVLLLHADGLEVRPGAGDKMSSDPEEAGRAMAQQALDGRLGSGSGPGSLLLTFCEGARGNLSAVVRGAQKVVGEAFPIVGGAAGDGLAFRETTQYCLSYLLKDSVVGLLLGGSLRFGAGSRHGFTPISRPRVVTRASGAVLEEIDGHPAVALYKDYLTEGMIAAQSGPVAGMAGVYPLGFTVDGEAEPLVRYPIEITDEGHLVCNGEIETGTQVRLMMGTREGVLSSAREAAAEARDRLSGAAVRGALVISSFAREKVMGREAAHEMRAVREVLGEGVPMIGMYGYGEIAPGGAQGDARPSSLRNDAIVVLTFGEA